MSRLERSKRQKNEILRKFPDAVKMLKDVFDRVPKFSSELS